MQNPPLLIQPDARLKRRLDYADLLLKQGSSAEPTPNWLAAAARIATGALGGYFRGKAEDELQARQDRANEGLAKALEAGKGWTNPDTDPDLAGQEALRVNDPSRTYLAAGERVGGGYEAVISALEGQRNPDLAPYAMQLRTGQFDRQQKLADLLAMEDRRERRDASRDDRRHERESARDDLRHRRDLERDDRKAGREAPSVQTFYDDEGREQKKVWNPRSRSWEAQGGSKAPPPRLVKVIDENGEAVWAPVSEAQGRRTPQAGRGGAPTLAQLRENESIEDARKRIASMGLSPEAVRSKALMDPVFEGLVKQAGRRKYGDDDDFENARNFVFGKRPAEAATADAAKLSNDELLAKLGIR